jgi:hypothetical protein
VCIYYTLHILLQRVIKYTFYYNTTATTSVGPQPPPPPLSPTPTPTLPPPPPPPPPPPLLQRRQEVPKVQKYKKYQKYQQHPHHYLSSAAAAVTAAVTNFNTATTAATTTTATAAAAAAAAATAAALVAQAAQCEMAAKIGLEKRAPIAHFLDRACHPPLGCRCMVKILQYGTKSQQISPSVEVCIIFSETGRLRIKVGRASLTRSGTIKRHCAR